MASEEKKDTCENCGRTIQVMAFKGGGYCSDLCRKVLVGELTELERLIIVGEMNKYDDERMMKAGK